MTGKQLIAMARQTALLGSRLKHFGDADATLSEEIGYSVTAVADHLQMISKVLEERADRIMFKETPDAAGGGSKMGRTTIIRVGIGSKSAEGCDRAFCRGERAETARRIKEYREYIERLNAGKEPSISYPCPTCSFTLTTRQIVGDTVVSCPKCQDIHFRAFTNDGDLYVTAREDDLEAAKRGEGECLS